MWIPYDVTNSGTRQFKLNASICPDIVLVAWGYFQPMFQSKSKPSFSMP
jgi:hypothetical protein